MKHRALVFLALLATAAPAGAQSLFGMRGLGTPVDPIDARSRALGSVGIGLHGLTTSMVNPAELSGIRRRGVVATLQPFYSSAELEGRKDNLASTRFPLIQLMYPIRQKLVFGLGYGGFLEQSWAVIAEGQEVIGGQTIPTNERVSSNGAIAQARLSAAYEMSPTLSVGVAAGFYTGTLQREVTRTFPDTAVLLDQFTRVNDWGYHGFLTSVGVRIDPTSKTRFSAALTYSGDIDANGETEQSIGRTYDMPLRLAAGGSILLSPRLLAAASMQYSGWSKSAQFSAPGSPQDPLIVARPTIEVGGGLEWEQLRLAGRIVPLRAGYRYAQLPFHLDGDKPANEWAASLGAGLRLASDDFGPLAVADFGLERGRRTGWSTSLDGGLAETFWRFSASVALFGR